MMRKKKVYCIYGSLITSASISLSSYAGTAYNECLLTQMQASSAKTTVAAIQNYCHANIIGTDEKIVSEPVVGKAKAKGKHFAVRERLAEETRLADDKYVILPHKPNYVLPLSYNHTMSGPRGLKNLDDAVDNIEVQFQVSLKARLVDGLIAGRGALYAGYTGVSWWQAYNSKASAPFRETNHEPEVWAAFATDLQLGDWTMELVNIGFNHQSNGRNGALSRSWNRIVADFVFTNGPFYISVRPWYRVPEEEKKTPNSSNGDDNPDIQEFMGHGELRGRYQFDNDQSLTVMLRNNLESGNSRGAVQLDYTFPLGGRMKGYVQYFSGYGESLIDYDNYSNRLGIGFMLTDWL